MEQLSRRWVAIRGFPGSLGFTCFYSDPQTCPLSSVPLMLEESRGWHRCLSLSGHRVSFFPPLEQPQTCCQMKGHLHPPECVCMQAHTPHTCVVHVHESHFSEVIGLSWANLPSPQQKPGHSIFFFFTLLAAHLHARRRLLYGCRYSFTHGSWRRFSPTLHLDFSFFTFVMCLVGAPLNDPPGTMLEGSTSGQEGPAHLAVQGGRQIVADSS